MKKEELIEELKNVPDVDSSFPQYFSITSTLKQIEYCAYTNEVVFYIYGDPLFGDSGTYSVIYDNLEPETILDLFRKWK